ncbi:MAG: hypothetical protein AAF268_08140 [Cyanobacteria bacterium P01_A01_bin.3]
MSNSLKRKGYFTLYGSLFAILCAILTAILSPFIQPIAGDRTILFAATFNIAALALTATFGRWTASTGFAIAYAGITLSQLILTSFETLIILFQISIILLAELAVILTISLVNHFIMPMLRQTRGNW